MIYVKAIFVTAILTAITTGGYPYYLTNTDLYIKWQISCDMRKKPEFVDYTTDQKSYYLDNEPFKAELIKTLDTGLQRGGLYVLAAPSHSEKSAHLQEILPDFMHNKKVYIKKVMFTGEEDVTIASLRAKLYIPKDGDLQYFLPKGSWIIFDQFDRKRDLTGTEKDVFTSLAALSFNSGGKFSILINISYANIFQAILHCNGKRKIFPVCDPKLLQIDKTMMIKYINKVQPNGDMNGILSRCETSKSIGATRDAALYGKTCTNKPDWEIFSVVYDNF